MFQNTMDDEWCVILAMRTSPVVGWWPSAHRSVIGSVRTVQASTVPLSFRRSLTASVSWLCALTAHWPVVPSAPGWYFLLSSKSSQQWPLPLSRSSVGFPRHSSFCFSKSQRCGRSQDFLCSPCQLCEGRRLPLFFGQTSIRHRYHDVSSFTPRP